MEYREQNPNITVNEQQQARFEERSGHGEFFARRRVHAETNPSVLDDGSSKRYSVTTTNWSSTRTTRSSSTNSGFKISSAPAATHRAALLAAPPVKLNSTADDSVFYSQQHDEILQTARGLCRDYICYRLKRSGFRGRVVITKYAPAKDQQFSFDVLNIGKALEDLHPHLYRNLARKLGYVLRSNEELQVLFQRLAANIVGPDPEECRWGRILALLAVAGALSVDCIAQGHTELIENMVSIFCDYIETNLVTWISKHGGWDEMAKTFAEQKKTKAETIFSGRFGHLASMVFTSIFVAGVAFTLRKMSMIFSCQERV